MKKVFCGDGAWLAVPYLELLGALLHKIAFLILRDFSGTKNEPKPKLLSPDIFRWGGGLPREGVGAKKFGMSLETQGIKLFWQDIPGFCRDIPEAPEKFEKKNVWVQFSSPNFGGCGSFPTPQSKNP